MISHLRTLLSRVRSSFAMRKLDDDFAQELESHFDLLTADNLRRGMSPGEARRAARLKLGGEPALRESHHEQRTIRWLESFGQDLRFAFRMLRKTPAITTIALLGKVWPVATMSTCVDNARIETDSGATFP